jgi:hypothetical protein
MQYFIVLSKNDSKQTKILNLDEKAAKPKVSDLSTVHE